MKDIKPYIPKWETLRIIGKSKIVSLTILVPFIGYLILFNNELFSYFTLAKDFFQYSEDQNSITEETVSRLYYLYYGLTVLGVSSIVFAFMCPPIVKIHKDLYEYLNNEIGIKTYARMTSFIKEFQKSLDKESYESEELQGYLESFNNSWTNAERECSSEGYSIVAKRNSEIEMDAYINVLRFNWYHYNTKQIYARLILTISYSLGFLLILYPSTQVFLKISLIIYNR